MGREERPGGRIPSAVRVDPVFWGGCGHSFAGHGRGAAFDPGGTKAGKSPAPACLHGRSSGDGYAGCAGGGSRRSRSPLPGFPGSGSVDSRAGSPAPAAVPSRLPAVPTVSFVAPPSEKAPDLVLSPARSTFR